MLYKKYTSKFTGLSPKHTTTVCYCLIFLCKYFPLFFLLIRTFFLQNLMYLHYFLRDTFNYPFLFINQKLFLCQITKKCGQTLD